MSGSDEPLKRSTIALIPRLVMTVVKSAPLSSIGLAVAAIGGGLVAAGELLIGKQIVDSLTDAIQGMAGVTAGDVFTSVIWLGVVMVSAIILEIITTFAEVDVQEKVGIRLQREVIEKAHSVELVHFEHPDFYDKLERANQDMGGRLVQLMRSLVDILGSVSGMTAIVAVLWQNHWSLAPITIVGVVPGFWVMLMIRKKTYWIYRVRTPESRLAGYFNALLTRRNHAKEVRLFTLSDHLLGRWLDLSKRLAVERRQLEIKQAWLGGLTDIFGLAAYAGCLMIVATLIAGARVTVGTFTMLMDALQRFANNIEQVMRTLAGLQEQSLYLADLYEFLDVDVPTETDVKRYIEVAEIDLPAASRIDLVDVCFTYPGGDREVLTDINLTIHAGERIALIGENGAGKSTLVRLIMGLYTPTRGAVYIDGVNVKDIPEESLYRHFAAVFQEYVQYQFPIRENIRFGRLHDATDDDILWASKLADAHNYITEFEEGYDTLLGRPIGGRDLSGGQWQKLAIARALVRKAPIVVLDEPTAALDPKAEAEIYRQFSEMTDGRTSILISHRLGSARLADRIIVLKGGHLEESGTHEQLIAANGEYAGFFTLQAQWYR